MGDRTALGHWVRRFLMEYAAAERNLSPNTCASYRDMLVLLRPFAARRKRAAVDELVVTDLSADVVRTFLTHLERDRQCSIATRNQRLASVHALARFIGERSPQHVEWAAQLRMIPIKKGDVDWHSKSVRITGKGSKQRRCPCLAGERPDDASSRTS